MKLWGRFDGFAGGERKAWVSFMSPLMNKGPNRRGRRNRLLRGNVFRCALASAVLLAGVAVSVSPAAAAGAVDEEKATVRAELIESLTTNEIWYSHVSASFSSSSVGVVYYKWNYENEPREDDWRSPGFVIFGTGDIAGNTVAMRIWTKGQDRFLEDASRKETENGPLGVALFGPSEDDVRLRITAKLDAEVLVNGEVVGSLGSQ